MEIENEKKKKTVKVLRIITLLLVALLVVLILIPSDNTEKNIAYRIRNEKESVVPDKAEIEIILPKKEDAGVIERIAKSYRDKYMHKKNVFIFYYLTDSQKMPYASSHYFDKKFDGVKIMQPIYGNLSWFADSLLLASDKIEGLWGDTLTNPFIIGMVKANNRCIFYTGFLEQKTVGKDIMLPIRQSDGNILYINISEPDKQEKFVITKDGNLEVYPPKYLDFGDPPLVIPPITILSN